MTDDLTLSYERFDLNIGNLEPSFDQVPYSNVIARLENGSLCINEFSRIIQTSLEVMQKNITFTSNISKTHLYDHEIPQSMSEKALGFLKNYHLFLAKEEVQYYKTLGDDVFKSVEDVKYNRNQLYSKHKLTVQNCVREVNVAIEALEKAKKQYNKAVFDYNSAKEKLSVVEVEADKLHDDRKPFLGRMLSAFESTPSQDKEKYQKKVEKRYAMVVACKNEIKKRRKILKEKIHLRDYAMEQTTEAAQLMEYDRLSCIKQSIKKFCMIENNLINTRKQLIDELEAVVDILDVDRDIQTFIQFEKKPEMTHKYSKAIELLEWDYFKRGQAREHSIENTAASAGMDMSASFISFDSITESITNMLPEANFIPEIDAAGNIISTNDDSSNKKRHDSISTEAMDDHLEEHEDEPTSRRQLTGSLRLSKIQIDENYLSKSVTEIATAPEPASSSPILTGNAISSSVNVHAGEISDSKVEMILADLTSALDKVFTENSRSDVVNEETWNVLLSDKKCRDFLLQELDDKRGTHSEMPTNGYHSLKFGMKILLDYCHVLADRKSALRVVNMANTFHLKCDESDCKDTDCNHDGDGDSRKYLLKEDILREHIIWHGKGFWEYCLMENISTQLQFTIPVLWDEMPPDALREAVINIHNIVFGQLVTLAFAMHEIGLSFDEVQVTILEMCRGAQLIEEQEHDLLRSIRKTFNVPIMSTTATFVGQSTAAGTAVTEVLHPKQSFFTIENQVVLSESLSQSPRQKKLDMPRDSQGTATEDSRLSQTIASLSEEDTSLSTESIDEAQL